MPMSFSSSFFASRRRPRGSSRRQRRDRATRQPRFEGLEARIVLTTDVWTGAAAQSVQDYSWSNALNWSSGAPQGGQDLQFPAAGASTFIPAQPIVNDLSGMTFDSIEIDAPGYTIGGDAITLSAATGLFTTYGSGVSTFNINTTLAGGNVDVASGGELDIDSVFSGSAGFALRGGGILGGTGQITALTVEGGEVQPGVQGAGDLTVQGGTTFSPPSTFSTSINSSGVNTALASFGSPGVALEAPALDISLAAGFSPAPGSSFTIIQGDVTGSFSGLPNGSTVTSGATTFRVSYGDEGAVLTAVQPTSVVTTLENATSPSVFGQSLTFTATVTGAVGTPTGTITFDDGSTVLATETVNASGIATFTTANLAIGDHVITSVYSGDSTFAASTSAPLDLTVAQASTTTTLSSSANPSSTGQNVTFTALVAPVAPGGGTPTGSVTFSIGTTQVAVVPLSGGSATYSTSDLTLGSYTIGAVYTGDTNFLGSVAASLTQNVTTDGSVTTIDSSANPSLFGQTVTFTADVTAAVAGSGTPLGSVNFFDGITELGTEPLSGGVASFSTSNLTRGSHTITAVYSGDSAFGQSTSPILLQNVNQGSTLTSVTASPPAIILGQSVTFTALVTPVSPAGGVPTGTVTFLDGMTELATLPLSGGSAAFSTSTLTLGSHSITAYYNGDGNDFLASLSSSIDEEVGGTSVALASSKNPSTFGQNETFTATVSADATGSSVPAGSVTFMDGTQSLGTVTLNASGVATSPVENLSGGTHAITAIYSGETGFATSTSSELDQLVNPASTTTTLTPFDELGSFSPPYSFDATVTSAGGTPTGSVTFRDNGKIVATEDVDSAGVANYTFSSPALGTHDLVATFTSNSGNFAPSTSNERTFDVVVTATSTVLTTSTSTPAVGQPVTFTANVAPLAVIAVSPPGAVVFHDGSTVIGTVPLTATGTASLTVAFSTVGPAQVIEATYAGSTDFTSSNSTNQTVSVVPATPTTTLVATPHFVRSKVRGVTFQVSVQAEFAGGPVPTGSVTLDIGRRAFRTVRLVNGSASVVVSASKARGKNFVVHYLGDANDKAEVSNVVHIRPSFFKAKPG
jgi:Bacterial Ig-like domain (group 3)